MAVIQLRIDEATKKEAMKIYEDLGLDLSTAIRIFLSRSIQAKGFPFEMGQSNYMDIWEDMSKKAKEAGLSDLSLDEINNLIKKTRDERNKKED